MPPRRGLRLGPSLPVAASKYLLMNGFPPLWTDSKQAVAWWERLRSEPRSVLLLDYDGTLAPFHVDRFAATPYPGIEDQLAALSELPRVRLVLITGRSARELRGLLRPGIAVEIWGSHGWEQLKADDSYQLFSLQETQRAALDRAAQEITAQGFGQTMEKKPSSIAIHWRSCEPQEQEQIRAAAESAFASLGQPEGLHLLPFDGGLELRASGRTKGTAVKQIQAEEAPGAPLAYLGDDLTDEDAFAAIGNRGLSFLVRSDSRPSCAQYWLRPPGELLEFLEAWKASAEALR